MPDPFEIGISSPVCLCLCASVAKTKNIALNCGDMTSIIDGLPVNCGDMTSIIDGLPVNCGDMTSIIDGFFNNLGIVGT